MNKSNSSLSTRNFIDRLSIIILYASMGLGCFFRFHNLGRESFWADEIFSALAATCVNIKLIFTKLLPSDVHPPLYLILLRGWARIFGTSEFALRASSACASVVAFFFMYHLTKKIFGLRIAVLATLLLVFSTASMVYAQELRSYSLLLLFSVITTLLWLSIIQRFHATILLKDFILYTAAALFASYLHYFGFVLIGFQLLYLIVLSMLYKRYYAQVGLIVASGVFLFLPWVVYQFKWLIVFTDGRFWIKSAPFVGFYKEFITFVFFCAHPERYEYRRIFFISLIFLGTIKLVQWRSQQPVGHIKNFIQPILPLLYLITVPYCCLFLASLLHPLLEARFLIILLPSFYVFLAYILNAVLPYPTALILMLGVWGSLACLHTLRMGQKICKQQWRESTQYALQTCSSESVLVALHSEKDAINLYDYYFDRFMPKDKKIAIKYSDSSVVALQTIIQSIKTAGKSLVIVREMVPKLPKETEEYIKKRSTTFEKKEFFGATVYICSF